MTDTDIIRADFEKELVSRLPETWNKQDMLFFLDNIRYDLDTRAVNKNLLTPARDFVLRGGKRIRPLLFLSLIELFGGKPSAYWDCAIAIELVHNGTLVLDDIEDRADMRRGKPTCHLKYGLDTAVNVGQSLHVLPLNYLLKSQRKLSSAQLLRLIDIYTDELTNVSFGQALDIYWHKKHPERVSEREYLEMVRLKTGSLMRMSLRFACVLMNKSQKIESLFSQVGESLGMAYQIIDDCLDLDPPNEKFGKVFGNDITEGKLSLPVIYTLKSASVYDRKVLIKILQKHTRDKRLITQAINIIKSEKSIDKSRNYAKRIVDKSWKDLEKKLPKAYNLDDLSKYFYFFVQRDH